MHVEPHDPPDRLAELIRAGPRARVARRLTAVRLALLGHTRRGQIQRRRKASNSKAI